MRRLLVIGLIVLAVLLVAGYFGASYVVYDRLANVEGKCVEHIAVNRPDAFQNVSEWPEMDYAPYFIPAYEEVRFPSRAPGVEIAGWYVERNPGGPTVVAVDGIGSCKYSQGVLLPAGMLARNGFNVLMIDLRDTGDSTQEDGRTAIGNEEYLDALGAFDWLVADQGVPPGRVGLLGNSLGGATMMNAFAAEPQVGAVFLNSPFSNLQQIMDEELRRNGYPTLLRPAALLAARVVAGDNLIERSPLEGIDAHGGRPIFIAHSLDDTRVGVHHSQQLEARGKELGADVTAWYLPSAEHTAGPGTYPEEWEQRMVEFFTRALGAPGDVSSSTFNVQRGYSIAALRVAR